MRNPNGIGSRPKPGLGYAANEVCPRQPKQPHKANWVLVLSFPRSRLCEVHGRMATSCFSQKPGAARTTGVAACVAQLRVVRFRLVECLNT